ncbi:pyridoxamine 5'-phosphate oxidase family protein [Desulfobacter hydrogenophilus]|uniref:Pyridoxamine 5'-phosphate oxidase family protein n=1 Tax=Desulfobacter hydrogenophilus TaxID=2291 RepID=A0A328FC91_9BACT|nr:pyridoxamine 5'-phosphate oxidase family protein [Desulfobacter hydrogenophilus]NDY72558.1 pyridoxamine 5'-phosphate oxidase family protein [Desulfobacter hydrogenophilus]QBH13282.1 pyridoxamine 5'-phosphate oxidase family protein [Desulfobacter hydrogenophilus]RAM01320.1 pyridoxamine 5'-phosphate oxidase family protein [Desulfobacter hydrogenophilus]
MSDDRQQVLKNIAGLFESQNLAVLSTQKDNQPYSNLVAFASSSDLKYFYFLTPNTTRKYEHLTANPKVSILVHDSQNKADDFYNAVSVTGTGVSEEIDKSMAQKALDLYLKKHPDLKDFSRAPTTAFIRISIKRYFMVNRFQNVVDVKP